MEPRRSGGPTVRDSHETLDKRLSAKKQPPSTFHAGWDVSWVVGALGSPTPARPGNEPEGARPANGLIITGSPRPI